MTPVLTVTPRTEPEAPGSGMTRRLSPNTVSRPSSQSSLSMSKASVREAFVKSVTWSPPPLSRHASHESMVPKQTPPSAMRRGRLSSWRVSQSAFVPLK
jgi:hypothetical protein